MHANGQKTQQATKNRRGEQDLQHTSVFRSPAPPSLRSPKRADNLQVRQNRKQKKDTIKLHFAFFGGHSPHASGVWQMAANFGLQQG